MNEEFISAPTDAPEITLPDGPKKQPDEASGPSASDPITEAVKELSAYAFEIRKQNRGERITNPYGAAATLMLADALTEAANKIADAIREAAETISENAKEE